MFQAWTSVMRMLFRMTAARRVSSMTRRGAEFSLEGDGVHQATLAPGRVQTAIELERARLADVALEISP